jgi:galactose mutarotase-like enzyme
MSQPQDLVAVASPALSAQIDPQGAQLFSLRDGAGRDLLWDGDPAFWTGRAPLLFPIVGSLNGGRYRLGDQTFELAKHGFARLRRFEVVQAGPGRAVFRLTPDAEAKAAYPFDFQLDMTFEIEGPVMTMRAEIGNRGESPLPFSFGFHPALRWPLPYGGARADHALTFQHNEPADIRRVGPDGLVSPDAQPTPVEGRILRLRDELFTDDAVIWDRLESRALEYGVPGGPTVKIAFPDTPHLGVWMKPGAGYVCIEPWQGFSDPAGFAGDVFDKPGVLSLPPGATHGLTMTIEVPAV